MEKPAMLTCIIFSFMYEFDVYDRLQKEVQVLFLQSVGHRIVWKFMHSTREALAKIYPPDITGAFLIFILQVDIGMLMASQWMVPCLAATACKQRTLNTY